MTEITRILNAIDQGDGEAATELLPLVYEELRRLASLRISQEPPGHTLQATALVHEAYLRLVGPEDNPRWDNRGHFFAAAAEAMRRILVESARRKRRLKRGGHLNKRELAEDAITAPEIGENLLELDAALARLEAKSSRRAQVVKLRYFAGLTVEETATALHISTSTVDRDWTYARAWLFREIGDKGQSAG